MECKGSRKILPEDKQNKGGFSALRRPIFYEGLTGFLNINLFPINFSVYSSHDVPRVQSVRFPSAATFFT